MSLGKIDVSVGEREEVISEFNKRKSAVRWIAGRGVVRRCVEMKEDNHAGDGLRYFEERCEATSMLRSRTGIAIIGADQIALTIESVSKLCVVKD